jgi:hypothetical protein
VILPVVLYGCKSGHIGGGGHRLRVVENTVLRNVFWPKRDEVTQEWKRLRKE